MQPLQVTGRTVDLNNKKQVCNKLYLSNIEAYHEAAAFARFTFNSQCSIVCFNKILGNRESQATARYLGTRYAEVPVEYAEMIPWINAFTKILHIYFPSFRACYLLNKGTYPR